MARTKKGDETEEVVEVESVGKPLDDKIQPLLAEYGRDDLNAMRDKINELIARQ